MKIAVDANQLNASFTGVGRYLYNLLKHMAPLAPEIEFTLFLSSDNGITLDNENIKKLILKTNHGNLFWQNFLLKKQTRSTCYFKFKRHRNGAHRLIEN